MEVIQSPPDAEADRSWVAGRNEFRRWTPRGVENGCRDFPEELPVAMVVNGESYAVMLASPADLADFAYGFLLTEGLIGDAADIESVHVHARPEGMALYVALYGDPQGVVRSRRMAGVSSCGLCGVRELRDAVRPIARLADGPVYDGEAIPRAVGALRGWQPYNAVAGAMHAAAFVDGEGKLLCAREDVGRHNALDKLIGAAARAGIAPESGFVAMSSRCSYELVQKASAFGLRLLATASAPTALAVRLAREANLSLACQVREDSYLILNGAERIGGAE
ncbi:MAG: formate dehydrogenase accessory sulfurtransferase FdhD [Gammaproteobacteria bacterium]|nr:formate dehydrogenase accessory sulfurtransferase FdhD [Gammaproteobacteria bacterium]